MFELIISLTGATVYSPGTDLFLNILKVQDQMLPVFRGLKQQLGGQQTNPEITSAIHRFMIFSRNQFFLLLFAISILPFFAYKLIWLATTTKTNGIVYFIGHGNLGSVLGISTYPVIRYEAGKDTIEFKGNLNLEVQPGETVSVRYQKNDPADAKINTAICIWGDTLAYSIFPFIVLLIIFFIPERFDPIVPKRSKILLGKKPLIKIIPETSKYD